MKHNLSLLCMTWNIQVKQFGISDENKLNFDFFFYDKSKKLDKYTRNNKLSGLRKIEHNFVELSVLKLYLSLLYSLNNWYKTITSKKQTKALTRKQTR